MLPPARKQTIFPDTPGNFNPATPKIRKHTQIANVSTLSDIAQILLIAPAPMVAAAGYQR